MSQPSFPINPERLLAVLFEDHTLAQLRPLSWSQPTFETRVGMFSLRDRVGHLLGGELASPGLLLARTHLEPLQRDPRWQCHASHLEKTDLGGHQRMIWFNGRLCCSLADLRRFCARASSGEDVFLRDEFGPLVMACSAAEGTRLLDGWRRWQDTLAASGALRRPDAPVPVWQPDLDGAPWELEESGGLALGWIWDVVPRTEATLLSDTCFLAEGQAYSRHPFGVFAAHDDAPWQAEQQLVRQDEATGQYHLLGNDTLWVGRDVQIDPGVTLDLRHGPIILENGVSVRPGSYLQGPLFLGAGSTVKAGAQIYGESSFGVVNRIAGEIGESTFGNFANKQHDGFMGHAVLGSWINLGAMTTCSDLKNNYGDIRVDLGAGPVNSGRRFVGLLMGDHAKTAIGTLFNTGTCVGFATNIFGGGMPPKFVPAFRWGGQAGCPDYAVEKALETARVVMSRRGCELTDDHEILFRMLASPGN